MWDRDAWHEWPQNSEVDFIIAALIWITLDMCAVRTHFRIEVSKVMSA